jgi:hypothetical protein
MNDKQRRRFERLVRAADFATSLADPLPKGSKGETALANLSTHIDELEDRDASLVTNVTSARQGTRSRQDARAALREQLDAIFETSVTIALDHPEHKAKFRRPPENANDQTLVSIARSYAAEAAPLQALFVEYNMPADFIDRLNASVDAFERSVHQQNTGTGESRSSRASIEAVLASGEQELERIETAITNKYRSDKATLAAWESVSRLERAPRKKSKETPQTPQQ